MQSLSFDESFRIGEASLFLQILMDFDLFLLRKILWARVAKKNEKGVLKAVYSILNLTFRLE